MLQNKALRCIYCNDNDSSTSELHIKAKLLTLQDRRNANLAATAHCQRLPCYNFGPARAIRSLENKPLPFVNCLKYEGSFIYKSIELWNLSDNMLKQLHSSEYKVRMKAEMLVNCINFPE